MRITALFEGGSAIKSISQDFRNIELIEDKFIEARYPDGTIKRFRLRAGAKSDLASVPQIAWSLGFTPFGVYAPAAVAHDLSYQDTLEVWDGSQWVLAHLTKPESDDLINALMFALGTPDWQRLVIYEALVAFGWPAFRQDRAIANQK